MGVPPILRATNEVGDAYDDPSEDLLLELLRELGPKNGYLIVERFDAPNDQYYMQVAQSHSGYVVEYRDGGRTSHFQAHATDVRVVHEVLTAWAFNLPGWRDALSWSALRV